MRGYRLQVLGYSLIFLLLFTVTCTLSPAYAADSTPSADVKTKLEELKKEIATRAAELKKQVSQKLQNKAYIGTLKTKSESNLTLATKGGVKMVNINQDTLFESQIKSRLKLSLKTLKEEDYLIALGDVDEIGVLTAKKIILHPIPSTLNPKSYLWGKIISISDQLTTLKDRDNRNVAVTLPSLVKLNDFVILTGSFNKNDIFEAEFVYTIPQGGFIKPKKVATPSAQVSTKSATPSGKKR